MAASSPTPGDAQDSAPETLQAEVIERAIDSIPLPGDEGCNAVVDGLGSVSHAEVFIAVYHTMVTTINRYKKFEATMPAVLQRLRGGAAGQVDV